MKTKSFTLKLLLAAVAGLFSLHASAQTETTLNQPQFGKQTVTVASDQVITYYDPYGEESIKGQTTYNGQSMVVFKPAEAGMSVMIEFENVDMRPYGSTGSYPAYLNIYNGEGDADNSFTWATTTSEVSSNKTLPTGDILAVLSGSNLGASKYYSTTTDGALSVGYLYVNATTCSGWKATVKCVKLEDMSVTGAGSKYDNVVASPKSRVNLPFATAYVTTKGMLNAANLTGISFKMTQNESAVDPLAMQLYPGDGSNLKDATALEATVAADGDGYTITLTQPLEEGTNEFTLVGAMLGTAEIGAKVQVDITKVTTSTNPTGVSPFTAGTSVVVENPAVVLMNSTPQTITVGETPLNFYDEGGIDGPIYARTNGQVTFLSGVEGKKVMVDFTKNQIWHGSLYNQELRIYSGQEVDAANLLKTLQQGETARVRSTAEDGSLTVVLFSDATNAVEANGFEALVSVFTPQPMTVNSITATQPVADDVPAGEPDAAILAVNVNTENTEPALNAQRFAFTTNGTYEIVTKAALYYTKGSNTFATDVKVGETTVTADNFTITATDPIALQEGDNYFWLAYDVNENALNDQTIDATIVSATLSGTTVNVSEGSPEGQRTVNNTVYSSANMGTLTKKVNGSITFKTENFSEYSTKYQPGTDDRINVFLPMHEGKKVQIDFSSFDIYYSVTSYGTRAKFTVYSGQGTSGKVLWQLTASADKSVGPGKVLQSEAEDGAITVVFNPNYAYSTYTANGWTATVSEFEATEEVEFSTAGQAEDGNYYASGYYSDKALTVPEGVTANTYRVSEGSLTVSKTYTAGEVVPAGQAVIFCATAADKYNFAVSSEAGTIDANSMLFGSDDTFTDNESGYVYYMLATAPEGSEYGVGFWWQTEGGASITNGAHKAYLKVPASAAAGIKGFNFGDNTTGISSVNELTSRQVDEFWYTLDGQRISAQPTQKGIYIHNGKKVIVK